MSLSFSSAFATLDVGSMVSVTNSLPEPSKQGGVPWRVWRSHNFTGELVEKRSDGPRAMVFRLPKEGPAQVSYTIEEGLGHGFDAA